MPTTPPRRTGSALLGGKAWSAIGAAIGGVAAVMVVWRSPLAEPRWVASLGGDAGSSFAAARAFAADGWGLPLLITDRIGPARSGSLVLLDGVPLFAILARLLRPTGLTVTRLVPWWYTACFVAQGCSAASVVRAARFRSRSLGLALIVALTASPVLFARLGHPALVGQAVLLATWATSLAWWRYRTAKWFVAGSATVFVAMLLHPYLVVMTAALWGSVVIGSVVRAPGGNPRPPWVRTLALAATSLVGLGAGAVALGYLRSPRPVAGGYGSFGMPVLSPVFPQWSGLVPGRTAIITGTSGSIEGFNYVGAGAVAAWFAAVLLERRRLFAWLHTWQVTAAVLTMLTAVAISPVVYVAGSNPWRPFGTADSPALGMGTLIGIGAAALVVALGAVLALVRTSRLRRWLPAVATLLGAAVVMVLVVTIDRHVAVEAFGRFRASGRFFWVVAPGAITAAFLALDRRAAGDRRVPALGVAVGLVVLQLVDVRLAAFGATDHLVGSSARFERLANLERLISGGERVHLLGRTGCYRPGPGLDAFQDVVIAATMAGRPVDNGYQGWMASVECSPHLTPSTEPGTISAAVGATIEVPRGCERLDLVVWCRPPTGRR